MSLKQNIKTIKDMLLTSPSTQKTLKNSSWLIFEKVFTMAIGVFVTAYVARYFGPDLYGQFNYALAFVVLFTSLSVLGLEQIAIKAIVNKEASVGSILCTSFIMRLVGGLALLLVASIMIRLIEPEDTLTHLLVFIISLIMIIKSLEVVEYWIFAKQKAKLSSSIRMGVFVLVSGLKLLLVFFQRGLEAYAIIYVIDALLIGLGLTASYFIARKEQSKWQFDFALAKKMLSKSWYFILSGLMITLYMRIDQVMLGKMIVDKTELGIYSAAVRIAEMWYFVPLALITSMQPVIMREKSNSEQKYLSSLHILFTAVTWLSILFGVAITIFSPLIIHILYGEAFLKASEILMISVWAGTFALLGSARGVWLVSEGLHRFALVFAIFGAVSNILLNLLLIPSLGGQGAAIATLASQFIVAFIAPLFFSEARGISSLMLRAFTLDILYQKQDIKK